MTITFDKKPPIYRCNDFLRFTLKLTPKAPTNKTSVSIKVGYGVSLEGSMKEFNMDFIVKEEKVEIPLLKAGESFCFDFEVKLPIARPSYFGYNASLKWAIETKISRISKSSGINKNSIAFFTLLPKENYNISSKDISIKANLIPSKDISQTEPLFKGLFKIKDNVKNFVKIRYEEEGKYNFLKAYISLLGSLIFGVFFLVAFFFISTYIISGQFLSILKEDAPIDGLFEWLLIYLLLSLPIILTLILAFIPLIFSLFFWRLSQSLLEPLFLKKLLGPIEISNEKSLTLGEIWRSNISFTPSKFIKVESLRILLIQQELAITHKEMNNHKKPIHGHRLSELELYEKLNFRISKNRKISYPFKLKIADNLPGTWSICYTRKPRPFISTEHEFSHRWVIRLEFKKFNKKPYFKEFPLLICPTENYNPKVSEPSPHY